MSVRIMAAVWPMDLSATDKMVLLALADSANDDGVAWPSIAGRKPLTAKTSLSERAIQKAIKALVAAGHLSRDERIGRGVVYHVHPRTTCTPAQAAPANDVRGERGAGTPARGAPKPSTNHHTSGSKDPSVSPKRASAKRGTRLPADFVMPDDWIEWAMADRGWQRRDAESEASTFHDHWIAKPGAPGLKLDWQATWRNWVRNSRRNGSNGKRTGFSGGRPSGPIEARRQFREQHGMDADFRFDES